MYRPPRIIDSHMHLLTAGTHAVKLRRMSELDPRLKEAYRRRWHDSLASRHEEEPEADPADVQTVARRWEAALDAAGIERGVFFTSPNYHDDLLTFISLNPGRFIGYTTLDPTDRANADLLRRQIGEHGMQGLKLYPMALGFRVDDEACDAVYEACEAARIPVVIHFGISINATHDLRYGNPLDLSGPALRFPSVNWIIPHFGAGFFREALMVAAQYQNVHIDTSSSNNWTKWTPDRPTVADLFRRTLDAMGPQRLIFGTDSSFFPRGYRTNILNDQLAICHDLGLSPQEIDSIFGGNIGRILDGHDPAGREQAGRSHIGRKTKVDTQLEALRGEIKNRALIYYEIYKQLSAEHGSEEAARLMGQGIYARGKAKGEQLGKKIGEPDLARLAQAFAEGKSETDAFKREVVEVSDTRTVLRLTRCPLVEAWDEAGLSPAEKRTMCDIACQVDFGKFEGAGYKLKFRCRIADGAGACDMELTK